METGLARTRFFQFYCLLVHPALPSISVAVSRCHAMKINYSFLLRDWTINRFAMQDQTNFLIVTYFKFSRLLKLFKFRNFLIRIWGLLCLTMTHPVGSEDRLSNLSENVTDTTCETTFTLVKHRQWPRKNHYEYRIMLSVFFRFVWSDREWMSRFCFSNQVTPHQFWTSLHMTSWHWLVGGFLRHRSVVHIRCFWWQLANLFTVSFQRCILWTMETGPNSVSSISQSETSGAWIKGHPSRVRESSHTNIQWWNKKGPVARGSRLGSSNTIV